VNWYGKELKEPKSQLSLTDLITERSGEAWGGEE